MTKSTKRHRELITATADAAFDPQSLEVEHMCMDCAFDAMEHLIAIARREHATLQERNAAMEELIAREEKAAPKVRRDAAATAKSVEDVLAWASEEFARLERIAACLAEIGRLAAIGQNAMMRPADGPQPEDRH